MKYYSLINLIPKALVQQYLSQIPLTTSRDLLIFLMKTLPTSRPSTIPVASSQYFFKHPMHSMCTNHPIPLKIPPLGIPSDAGGDFKFVEIALEASLNKEQVKTLLSLIFCVAKGKAEVTFWSEAELHKLCNWATEELTPVSRCEMFQLHTVR